MMDNPQPEPASSTDGITSREVTDLEVRQFAEAVGLERAAPGRSSRLFMFQIYLPVLIPKMPGDPIKIVAEVQGLEGRAGPIGTKPAEQFSRLPLKGLWKKHCLVGGLGSMAKNIALGFGKNKKELRRIIRENHNPETAHLPPETIARNLANAVTNLYAERSKQQRLTGDWIIYAQHEGQNYYLSIAQHSESDAAIFERITRGCLDEFPFLRNTLSTGLGD